MRIIFITAMLWICGINSSSAIEKFLPFFEKFNGSTGAMPTHWNNPDVKRYPMMRGSGLTLDYLFEGHTPVLRLVSGTQTVVIHSQEYQLPAEGEIRFTIWARSVGKTGKVEQFIIADKYHFWRSKKTSLTEEWQKISLQVPVPTSIKKERTFRFRIDVPPGSNDILIGQVQGEYLHTSENNSITGKNLVDNGNFTFGAKGFNRMYYHVPVLNNTPVFTNGHCILKSRFYLYSEAISYQPNTPYTAIIRMKNARRGTVPAEVRIFLLPQNYNGFATRKIQLTDDFQDYILTGTLPPSAYNQMVFRLDIREGVAEIERIQVTKGIEKSFLPLPAVELGGMGKIVFDFGTPGATLAIRIRQNSAPVSGTLNYSIKDSFGKVLKNGKVPVSSSPDQIFRLPLDTSVRGVFSIKAEFRGTNAEIPYAVMKNLSGQEFPENVLAGHFYPYESPDISLFQRYLPIEPNINRWFLSSIDALDSPAMKEGLRRYPFRNVICPTWSYDPDSLACQGENELTPQLEKYMEEVLERIAKVAKIHNFEGIEPFNEPHLWKKTRVQDPAKRGQASMWPEKTAYLYRKTREILKRTAPGVKLYGPCTHFSEKNYNERFMKAGGAEVIDVFTFHAYNDDPDRDHVAEENLALKKMIHSFKPGMPIYNTEVYYGIRKHKRALSDDEAMRNYVKNTEMEHACAYAAFYANSVVSATPFCSFANEWMLNGMPDTDSQYPTLAGAALNAAIEMLGNSGKEKIIFPLNDALRCFLFPSAKGGAVATLRVLHEDSKISVSLPDTVQAFDIFGNRIAEKKINLGNSIVYLKFAAGTDAAQTLRTMAFEGLGMPLSASLAPIDAQTLGITIRNSGFLSQNIAVSLIRYPREWTPKQKSISLKLAPFTTQTVKFPMIRFPLHGKQDVLFRLEAGTKQRDVLRTLKAFPVRYSPDFTFFPKDYSFMGKKNLSKNFSLTEKWIDEADCSSSIAALWNQRGLMLSVKVNDNVFYPPEDYLNAYKFDSVQIYFDMGNKQSYARKGSRSGELNYSIGSLKGKSPFARVDFSNGTRFIGKNNATVGLDSAVKVELKQLKQKTIEYLIFFPTEALYRIKFIPGSVFGFSLLINDNDGKGRKQGITLAPAGTEPLGNTQDYWDMILLGEELTKTQEQ